MRQFYITIPSPLEFFQAMKKLWPKIISTEIEPTIFRAAYKKSKSRHIGPHSYVHSLRLVLWCLIPWKSVERRVDRTVALLLINRIPNLFSLTKYGCHIRGLFVVNNTDRMISLKPHGSNIWIENLQHCIMFCITLMALLSTTALCTFVIIRQRTF